MFEVCRMLQKLINSPKLYAEEPFPIDFKIGVFAPFFFPTLFPLIGYIYKKIMTRKS